MSSRLSSLERRDARIQLHLHFVDFLVSLFLYHACRFFGDFSSAQEPLYLHSPRFLPISFLSAKKWVSNV